MIKKNTKYKQYYGPALKGIGLTLATAAVVCGALFIPNFNVDAQSLPSQDEVSKRLLEVYGSEDEMFLLGELGDVYRLPAPIDKDSIKVNFSFDTKKTEQVLFEDVLTEFNEIFEKINPGYKFEANFSPTKEDFSNVFSIDVNKDKLNLEFDVNGRHGVAKGGTSYSKKDSSKDIDGKELYSSKITLDESLFLEYDGDFVGSNFVLNKELRNTFAHEFCHTLGLGDAYYENASANTVMQTVNANTLSSLDVATLAAMYYPYGQDMTKDEELDSFIKNYDKDNIHVNYEEEYIINSIKSDMPGFKDVIQQSNYDQKTKQKVISNLDKMGSEVARGKDFGESMRVDGQATDYKSLEESSIFCKIKDSPTSYTVNFKEYNGFLFVPRNGETVVYFNVGDNLIELPYKVDDLSFKTDEMKIYEQTEKSCGKYFADMDKELQGGVEK